MSARRFVNSATVPRLPRDTYRTPSEAALPLLRHLPTGTRFLEPCAGDGALVRALDAAGHVCVGAFDIAPAGPGIESCDGAAAVFLTAEDVRARADAIVTNPPFAWSVLARLLEAWLESGIPTWLLLWADFRCSQRSARFMQNVTDEVMVGKVSWMGNGVPSTDNFMWVRFHADEADGRVRFHPQGPRSRRTMV